MTIHTLYQSIVTRIARVRRAEVLLALQTGVLNALAGLIALWTTAVILEYIFEFGIGGRTILFWSGAVISAAILVRTLAVPVGRLSGLIKGQNDDAIARRVGSRIEQVGDRLVNTLQLYRATAAGAVAGGPGVSMELTEASILSRGQSLLDHDYSIILDREERRRALLLFFSAALMCGAVFFAFSGGLSPALDRLANFRTHYQKPAPFVLAVEPGNVSAVRGDSVEILVRATGIPPRTVSVFTQDEGSDVPDEIELRETGPGLYRLLMPNLRRTVRYHAEAAGIETEEYAITVVERPELREMVVTVSPPRYTGRLPEQLPEGYGDVSGLRGTGVAIAAETSIPVVRAEIIQLFPRGGTVQTAAEEPSATENAGEPVVQIMDTVRIPMQIEGTSIRGSFALTRDGEYYLSLLSGDSLQNPSPIRYSMSVSVDASPTIALVQPTSDLEIDETMLLPTQVRIADDYGFSRLRLMYRLTASRYELPWEQFREQIIDIPDGSSTGIDVPYLWNLTKSRLVPEDEIEFYFEVYDNDVVSGPKVARTGTIKVRFPSFEEMMQEAETMQDKATADLEKLMERSEQARRDMEEVDRELSKQLAQKKSEANWQQQQKLEELIRQHEEMQKQMEQIAEDLRTMAEKLQEAKAISPETLQKYQELQKLFEEVKSPELMESMRQLQREMDRMSPEQMAEAMKNYKFNEEQFRQSIERTKKILERMRTQQKADELVRRAERLAEQQEQLNKDMDQAQQGDRGEQENLAERQQSLSEEAEKLQQESDRLAESMQSQQDVPTEQMDQANSQLQESNPSEQMQQSAQQMQRGQQQQAQQSGQQAQKSVQDFQEQMQSVRDQMREEERRQVLNKMKKSLQDMLELSRRQEDLRNRTDNAQPNSSTFRDLAREQSQISQDMRNLANQLGEIGEKSFSVTPEMAREMGNAMQQMANAQQSLEARSGYSASREEGDAMSSMNSTAMMMSQAIGQMQNQGSQGGSGGMSMESFRQRLGQLAAQQQMINMAMGQGQQGGQGQQQQGQGEGEGNGEGQQGGKGGQENGGNQGHTDRLTRQQQEVKKSLDDLNREAKEMGGTRKNQVGDLERAAREVEEVLRDMQSGQISEQTLRRQEQILSRMLDAMKSQRERDFEKKRESKSGQDVLRDSPPELTFDDDDSPLEKMRDELRDGKQGYSRDYEYLIRKYFEALGE